MKKFYLAALILIIVSVAALVSNLNAPSKKPVLILSPTPQVALTKEQQKQQIDDMLSKANHCKVREDCIVQSYGCPFGCYSLVNKNDTMSSVEKAVDAYNSDGNSCTYKCAAPPEASMILCNSGKCVDSRYEPQ